MICRRGQDPTEVVLGSNIRRHTRPVELGHRRNPQAIAVGARYRQDQRAVVGYWARMLLERGLDFMYYLRCQEHECSDHPEINSAAQGNLRGVPICPAVLCARVSLTLTSRDRIQRIEDMDATAIETYSVPRHKTPWIGRAVGKSLILMNMRVAMSQCIQESRGNIPAGWRTVTFSGMLFLMFE